MQPLTFKSPFFAVLESFVPQLLAEAQAPTARIPKLAAGQVGIFGPLGQSEGYVQTDYADIRASVRRAAADPSVKNIDLIIDSPGGSVNGLPETGDAMHAVNKVKPVRAFVTGICASAAYWIGSQASSIHVTQSGEIGSVGILDLHADISKALDNAGVKLTAVTAGPHKTERAPFTPLSDGAKAHMQTEVDRWYGDFLSAIRRGRGARVSASSNFGGGRMLGAKAALAEGLIDFVGGVL